MGAMTITLSSEASNGGSQGAGTWVETIKPGEVLGLNPTTMPHALIREANGTYTFRELSQAAASSLRSFYYC